MDKPKLDLTKPEDLDAAFSRQRNVSCREKSTMRSIHFLKQKGPSMWDARYRDQSGVQCLKDINAMLKEHWVAPEPYEELTFVSGRIRLSDTFLDGLSDEARMVLNESMERLRLKSLQSIGDAYKVVHGMAMLDEHSKGFSEDSPKLAMWQRNRAKRPEGFLPKKSEDEKAKSCQPSKKRSREESSCDHASEAAQKKCPKCELAYDSQQLLDAHMAGHSRDETPEEGGSKTRSFGLAEIIREMVRKAMEDEKVKPERSV